MILNDSSSLIQINNIDLDKNASKLGLSSNKVKVYLQYNISYNLNLDDYKGVLNKSKKNNNTPKFARNALDVYAIVDAFFITMSATATFLDLIARKGLINSIEKQEFTAILGIYYEYKQQLKGLKQEEQEIYEIHKKTKYKKLELKKIREDAVIEDNTLNANTLQKLQEVDINLKQKDINNMLKNLTYKKLKNDFEDVVKSYVNDFIEALPDPHRPDFVAVFDYIEFR